MNSIIGLIIADVIIGIGLAAPGRIVTRTLRDFADRTEAELRQGVLTVISRGQPTVDPHNEHVDLLIVGQALVDETADGAAREEIELLMAQEIKDFADNLYGCNADVGPITQSAQLEAPYQWVSTKLALWPFDLSSATGTEPPGSFVTYNP
jgi:hypothetical protein